MPAPLFGIEEGTQGVLVGLGANDKRGCVVEMEYRRKSGRGIEEWFFLPELGGGEGEIMLLEDQELFRRREDEDAGEGGVEEGGGGGGGGGGHGHFCFGVDGEAEGGEGGGGVAVF